MKPLVHGGQKALFGQLGSAGVEATGGLEVTWVVFAESMVKDAGTLGFVVVANPTLPVLSLAAFEPTGLMNWCLRLGLGVAMHQEQSKDREHPNHWSKAHQLMELAEQCPNHREGGWDPHGEVLEGKCQESEVGECKAKQIANQQWERMFSQEGLNVREPTLDQLLPDCQGNWGEPCCRMVSHGCKVG